MLLELFLQKELRKENVVQRIQQPFSNWSSVQQTKLANREGSERWTLNVERRTSNDTLPKIAKIYKIIVKTTYDILLHQQRLLKPK
jgi:hypothetical protein